jgi:tryptophan-rich sensory protein
MATHARPNSRSLAGWAVITVPLVLGLGLLSGWLSNSGFGNRWFDPLAKPDLMPPGWAFGAVWTTLYVLMGLALAMVLAARDSGPRRRGIILFLLQLALNYSWSPVFFGSGLIDGALLIILAMNVLVTGTIIAFWRVRHLAGALLLPYLLWLCLATTLNWQIGELNPGADRAPLGITGA